MIRLVAQVNDKRNFFILGLASIVLLDLFFHIMPCGILFVLIFVYQLFFCNKYETALMLILFIPSIAGAFLISKGIPGVGGWCIPLGLFLIIREIYKERKRLILGYIPLLIMFVWFGVSAYLNEGGDYYKQKLLATFIYGTLSYVVFYIYLKNRENGKNFSLALMLLLWGVFLLRLAIEINHLPGPSSFAHFGFLRDQTNPYGIDVFRSIDEQSISYHLPGFFALMGLALFITDIKKSGKFVGVYVWCLALAVIFYAGARQNILAYVILLIFFISVQKEKSVFFRSFLIGTVGIASVFLLRAINAEVIYGMLVSRNLSEVLAASGRDIYINRGWELFATSPILGIGFGHYDYMGEYNRWPHNMFVELFCEIGLVGVIFIFTVCLGNFFQKFRKAVFFKKANVAIYLMIIPLFVRAMVSGSMVTNILLFSVIFALTENI